MQRAIPTLKITVFSPDYQSCVEPLLQFSIMIRWASMVFFASLVMCPMAEEAFDQGESLEPRATLAIDDPKVLEVVNFAVGELQELSDSGIYETLSLHRIVSAASQQGVFHFNYFLELELASPHYASGKSYESFEMMVMKSDHDGVLSFAIDEFPEMHDDSIEEFWIRQIERNKAEREAAFEEMEREYIEEQERLAATAADAEERVEELRAHSTKTLRKMLSQPSTSDLVREVILNVLDERLDRLEKLEESSRQSPPRNIVRGAGAAVQKPSNKPHDEL